MDSDHTLSSTSSPDVIFSQRRDWASRQAISFLMQQGVENPDVLSLAAGLVDYTTLPTNLTVSAVEAIFADESRGQNALQYGTTAGSDKLRTLCLEHFAKLEKSTPANLGIDINRMVLTTGSQQLLSLICEMLFDPGDICLVAAPTYFVFLGTLEGVNARVISVDSDEDGMIPEALEKTLHDIEQAGELHRVKLIYAVSYYDNPQGVSISEPRRPQIVDIAKRWSRQHRIMILEDAAYRELYYDGPQLPSIWSFDESREHVILTQTFSKSFSPGLRVGWGVLPKDCVKPVNDRKGNEDFGSSNFAQQVLAEVISSGQYVTHVDSLRNSYREKRDAMVDAAEKYFSPIDGVSWVIPHGGLYVWMTLPPEIKTGFDSPLFQQATKHDRVMYVPGELFYVPGQPHFRANQMRLSYGIQSPTGINDGMKRLANAVSTILKQSAPSPS